MLISFVSNVHKCRLMRPDGYMSWFVSCKHKEWEVFQSLEGESTVCLVSCIGWNKGVGVDKTKKKYQSKMIYFKQN